MVRLGGDPDTPEPESQEDRGAVIRSLRPPAETRGLLAAIEILFRRFIVLPSDAGYLAVALFVLHSWAFDAAHATPYIVIESPEKRSGKTRLLDVLALLCRSPLKAASVTAAAVYQSVESRRPTLLIDECDAVFGGRG